MEFRDVVSRRQSIRRFSGRDVTEEQLRTLLEWAHEAPSAGNLRPWEFIVIRDPEQMGRAAETTFVSNSEGGGPHQEWIRTASAVIAVCADQEKIDARYGRCSLRGSIGYLDCSAAVENILLGAVELGLAACYVSGFREEELSRVLGLPESVFPIALVPVGWPKGETPRRQRGPAEEHIHRERYGARGGDGRNPV